LDLLKTGRAWLEGQRKSHMASPVLYCRGEAEVEVAATMGKTEFEYGDEAGFVVKAHVTDFLIATADLVVAGQQTLPLPGDRITADGVVYEVMSLAGQGHYRFCDPHRNTLRIHTKQVDTEV
jgi:hypothetical protein